MGQNRGRSYQIFFIPNKLDCTFRAPNYCAKFHQHRIKIAAVEVFTDRLTEWQTDACNFKICPLLCYSNGTDKNQTLSVQSSDVALYVHSKEAACIVAVQGCRKFEAPAGSTVTEEGNTATARCNGSRETFYFTCTNTRWRGRGVNCTNKGLTQSRKIGRKTFFHRKRLFKVRKYGPKKTFILEKFNLKAK